MPTIEDRILSRAAEYRLNREIAQEFGITKDDVKAHLAAQCVRYGCTNKIGLIRKFLQNPLPALRAVADNPFLPANWSPTLAEVPLREGQGADADDGAGHDPDEEDAA